MPGDFWGARIPVSPLLFTSQHRQALVPAPGVVLDLLQRRVDFHDLRHGFASLAFAAGVPLKVVSEALGHSGIAITSQTYVHLLDDLKRDKSDRLDAYLDGVFDVPPASGLRSLVTNP